MTVKLTVEDGIARLVLANPPLNILTRAVLGEVRERLSELEAHADLRVVLLSAEGKHFSAGADVGEHLPPEFEEMIPEFVETIQALYEFPLPTVGAVRGRCLGGGFELVQAVDLVLAGEGAAFGQPEIVLGVLAPAAGALLPALAAPALAAEVLYTGDPIDARRALAAGLLARVVPDAAVDDEALALAKRIARHSGAALRATKRTLRAGAREARRAALAAARGIYVDELMRTADALEGLTAFLEKRQATWTHR